MTSSLPLVKADKSLLFLDTLMNIMRSFDDLTFTLNAAVDKITYHQINDFCVDNYCSKNTHPPIPRPDMYVESFVPRTCVQQMVFLHPDHISQAIDAMRIFSMIEMSDCEKEIKELLPSSTSWLSPDQSSYESQVVADNKASLLAEICAVLNYCRQFLLSTYKRQKEDLLSLKLLFLTLPIFQPSVYKAPIFFHVMNSFDSLFSNFSLMMHYCRQSDEEWVLSDDYFGSSGIHRLIAGRILGEDRCNKLLGFVIRPPDFTPID